MGGFKKNHLALCLKRVGIDLISIKKYISKNLFFFISVLLISAFAITPLFSILNSLTETLINDNSFDISVLLNFTKNSLIILILVIFLTFFLGVIPSYLISFYKFYGSNFFKYSLILSLAIPPYIYGYSISSFFENYGTAYSIINFINPFSGNEYIPKFSPMTFTVVSLSLSLYGYVYLLSMTAFNNKIHNYIEISQTLGFNPFARLTKIILPLSRPAIFIGLSLVAMETLSDFGTVSHFGVSTFTTGIYNSWFIFDDIQTSNFLSIILLIFILLFFLIENTFQKRKRFHDINNSQIKNNNISTLSGWKSLFAFTFCLTLFLASFAFPIMQMLFWSLKHFHYFNLKEIMILNYNTFLLILVTSLILISFAFFCNFGNRMLKNKFLNFISNLSIAGYAIPGLLIAIAVITFFSSLSNLLNINIKNLFIGSIIGLIVGYFFRFYSIAFNGIKSNYLKINYQVDESGYLLGLNKFDIFSKIHLPILKENTFFIVILISLEIIKELPITLILRPFNFETFSTKAFNYASQDLIEAASIPSLFLVMWTSLLILISSKYFLKK